MSATTTETVTLQLDADQYLRALDKVTKSLDKLETKQEAAGGSSVKMGLVAGAAAAGIGAALNIAGKAAEALGERFIALAENNAVIGGKMEMVGESIDKILTRLLPAFETVLEVTINLVDMFDEFIGKVSSFDLAGWFDAATSSGTLFGEIWESINGFVEPFIGYIEQISELFMNLLPFLVAGGELIGELIQKVVSFITDALEPLFDMLGKLYSFVNQGLSKVNTGLKSTVASNSLLKDSQEDLNSVFEFFSKTAKKATSTTKEYRLSSKALEEQEKKRVDQNKLLEKHLKEQAELEKEAAERRKKTLQDMAKLIIAERALAAARGRAIDANVQAFIETSLQAMEKDLDSYIDKAISAELRIIERRKKNIDAMKQALIDFGTNSLQAMSGVVGLLETLANGDLLPAMAQSVGAVGEKIGGLGNVIGEMDFKGSRLISGVLKGLGGFVSGLGSLISAVAGDTFKDLLVKIKEIPKMISESFPDLSTAALEAFDAILDSAPMLLDALIEHLPAFIERLLLTLAKSLPTLLPKLVELLFAVLEGVMSALFPLLIGLLASLPKIIIQIVWGVLKSLFSLFVNESTIWLAKKVKQLTIFAGQWILDLLKSIGSKIAEWIKSLFTVGDGDGRVFNDTPGIIRSGGEPMSFLSGDYVAASQSLSGLQDMLGMGNTDRRIQTRLMSEQLALLREQNDLLRKLQPQRQYKVDTSIYSYR